jgi:hypothetical protein
VRLLIVGFRGGTHIGGSLARAAERLGVEHKFLDASRAFAGPRLLRLVSWRLRGHRPPALRSLSREVESVCARWRPRWLLTTGLAPVDDAALAAIGRLGVRRLNFLTDDPWNPAFCANWFFEALRQYDHVFTPRRANLADLTRHGRGAVTYLPFAFDPDLSFREEPRTPQEWSDLAADVAFVGGADRDRVPYVSTLIRAGVRVAVYGGYWDHYPETRGSHRGHADLATVRKATSAAKVSLCLVRRANRDGHVMRSFEIPAMGGCILLEDTDEHRALFGRPGESAAYFHTIPEMVDGVHRLLSMQGERIRLAAEGERRIRNGSHTYADRLQAMLTADDESLATSR